jgi:hypothetical protein
MIVRSYGTRSEELPRFLRLSGVGDGGLVCLADARIALRLEAGKSN